MFHFLSVTNQVPFFLSFIEHKGKLDLRSWPKALKNFTLFAFCASTSLYNVVSTAFILLLSNIGGGRGGGRGLTYFQQNVIRGFSISFGL